MKRFTMLCQAIFLCQLLNAQTGFNKHFDFEQTGLAFTSLEYNQNSTVAIYGNLIDNNLKQGLLFSTIDTFGNILDYHAYFDSLDDVFTLCYPNSFVRLENQGGFAGIGSFFYNKNGYLAIYNNDGSIRKLVEYDDPNTLVDFYIEIIEVPDGFFILGDKQMNDYHTHIFLIKTDKEGKKLWEKSYGHPTRENAYSAIVKVNDNAYVIGAATTTIPSMPQLVYNTSNFYVIDSLGNLKSSWQSQPSSTDMGVGYGMQRTEQGGWVYATIEGQFEPPVNVFERRLKLIERDSNYNLVNERTFGDFNHSNFLLNLKKLSNGDFLILGQRAVKKTPPPPYTYTGLLMGSLLRLTPSGDSIWNYLDTAFTFANNIIYDAIELPSGSIIACGYSRTTNPEKDWGWVIKVSKDGCIDTLNCTPASSIVSIPSESKLKVYPNPASDIIYLDTPEAYQIDYQIYNMSGLLVRQGSQTGGAIDIRQLNPGGYILKIFGKDGLMVKKIMKI